MLNGWLAKYNVYLAQDFFLLLLLLVPVYIYLYRRRRSGPEDQWSYTGPVTRFTSTGNSWLNRSKAIQHGLRLIAAILIIIGLSRPQITQSYVQRITEGIDIMLSLDVSGSMLSEDFTPTRLEAALALSEEFIDNRPGDRIGMVIFSGESFTQCPLTLDHRVLKGLMRSINSNVLVSGTNIGNGLASAINNLKNSNGTSKIIILLSDGYEEIDEGFHISPQDAVKIANEFGIRVYTVGIGTIGKALTPVRYRNGQLIKEYREVKLDEPLLKEIAASTGGQYFRATENTSLKSIYSEIDKMEKSTAEYQAMTEYRDIFYIFLLLAFLCIFIEIGLKYSVFRSITE